MGLLMTVYPFAQRNTLGITYDAIETAYAGYCYGDSTSGQLLIETGRLIDISPLTL